MRRAAAAAACAALLAAAPGCEVNPFCIDCDSPAAGDAGAADSATTDATVVLPDACIPRGAFEVCDGLDDDCDGEIDEDAMRVGDPCGTDVGPCELGTLECIDGEIACRGDSVLPTPEECNGIDDDCDGTVDDGNPGGGMVCGTDLGECQRGITECSGGDVVCVGDVGPSPELCDVLDNDCDGTFDEGNPEGGAACGGTGSCMPGTEMCIGGSVVCVGGDTPSPESCDGADNDCDGDVDEDFDFDSDPSHCGDCTTVCSVANGQAGCAGGGCVIAYCFTGFFDLNGDVSDGCEYACDFAGSEVCNGADDDCDGVPDEDLTPPDICSPIGECAGTTAACMGAGGWQCPYPPSVSTDASGDIIPETDCDGLDNDCDGVPDDFFTELGDACTRGLGDCETSGTVVCNAAEDGTECDAPDPPAGDPETCNGLDDDCDGTLDEDVPDAWVQVGGSLWIYQYEASRPDADAASQGVLSHRPCSGANRLPWTNVTQPDAEALCVGIGARLCTETEWQTACESTSGSCTWSFDTSCSSYQPDTCNGNDYDFDPGTAPDDDGLLPTGALAACFADWGGAGGVFDMSGNVKEWTVERAPGANPLRGGSYNNAAGGLTCGFDFALADDTFQFQNVGFRCCRDTAP